MRDSESDLVAPMCYSKCVRRADFDAVAEQRYARIVESGKTIPWSEIRGYLERRVAGKTASRPAARKLAKQR